MRRFFEIQTKTGEPINHGDITLTPFSQSVSFRLPGLNGGLIWNRPVSLLSETKNGQEQLISIPDVTRQLQWGILGASLGCAFIMWILSNRIRFKSQENR
jgi:hypothetical protein